MTVRSDEGLVFDANGYFSFELGRFLTQYILMQQKNPQTIQFAFVPTSPSTTHQLLAAILFNNKRLFEVILNKNGSINVGITDDSNRVVVRTFVGNFSDGHRHFFVARFHRDQATVVTKNLDLYDVIEITLGGQQAETNNSFSVRGRKKYRGCISNLNIDFGVADFHITPISDLYNSSYSLGNYTHLIQPNFIRKSACGPFRIRNSLPVFHELAELPIWETNFKRLVYRGDIMNLFVKEEGKFWIWIATFIILLVLSFLIVIVVFCYWLMRTEVSNKPITDCIEEEQPLQTSPPEGILYAHKKFSINSHLWSVTSNANRVAISEQQHQNNTNRQRRDRNTSKQRTVFVMEMSVRFRNPVLRRLRRRQRLHPTRNVSL
ncbi:hypothetical protein DICVIV_05726 [Dictyocaulus viviparus]|uniref:Laminin G domain-containing protein n=1 Tax=Dictyocaulus viviparus TaxID=29172 RepID=A0A0D8XWG2_DICVI|nr:hypothetical protein DICVIV_05726 [Dictyocaulus viviparus]